jgi:hypothetical protein
VHDPDTVPGRRRRTVLTASAIVAAVVVAVATGVALTAGDHPTAPRPIASSPSRTSVETSDVRAGQVVHDGRLVSYAVNGHGSLLTVWQRCGSWEEASDCRTAWQLQGRVGTERGLVRGNFAGADAAGDFVVVTSWRRPGVLVDDRGRTRPLRDVASGTLAAADALVRLGKSLGVVDPVTAESWPLPAPVGVDGWVEGAIAPDGTVWATASVPAPPIDVRVSWLPPGTTHWQHHTISTSFEDGPAPGPLAVSRDRVATASMHDGVDVATYGVFAVTTDAGATWSDLRPHDLPFDNVDAMAATSSGTLFVASQGRHGADRVFRSTDGTWRHFARVPEAAGAFDLVAAGDRVVARRGTPNRPELLTLDDAGQVTSRVVLG